MPYTFSKGDTGVYELVAAGEYEAIIESIEIRTVPTTGTEKIAISYKIRSDVDGQKFGGRILFEDIWKEKSDQRFYNRKRLNQLMGTQKISDGQSFENIEAVLNFLKNSNIVIVVRVEHDTYYNKNVNSISYYKSSKFVPQSLKTEIADEDLPF
jgi:hypothetical protein